MCALLAAHVSGGNDPDFRCLLPPSESGVQQPAVICLPQDMNADLGFAMFLIGNDQQRLVEKELLSLTWSNPKPAVHFCNGGFWVSVNEV
jgi:hypothetical protein